MKTLEELVNEWTKAHTRTAIASAIGCSGPTLSNKINGTSELTFSEAETLARTLGVSLEEIAESIHATRDALSFTVPKGA